MSLTTARSLTIAEIAAVLGVRRPISYRILRIFEEHSLVLRDDAGRFSIGPWQHWPAGWVTDCKPWPPGAYRPAATEAEWEEPAPGEQYREESHPSARLGFAVSRDEVLPGVSSVAVPIRVTGQLPAALAVVYLTSDVPAEELGARVLESAAVIEQLLR